MKRETVEMLVGAGCETPAFSRECPITPNIDFIFVRRLKEKQSDTIIKPDQYQQDSDKAVILAVGPGRVVGNQLVPIEWEVGDVVDITKYGIKRESGEYIRCGDVYGKVNEHSAT